MLREGGAPSNPRRSLYTETPVVTGSSAFADEDSGESSLPAVAKLRGAFVERGRRHPQRMLAHIGRPIRPLPNPYSDLMPSLRTRVPHFAASSRMSAACW